MPRFDGTGPRGEGPFTGRGEGYCAVRLPDPDSAAHGGGEPAIGFAGQAGRPVLLSPPYRVAGAARRTSLATTAYGPSLMVAPPCVGGCVEPNAPTRTPRSARPMLRAALALLNAGQL